MNCVELNDHASLLDLGGQKKSSLSAKKHTKNSKYLIFPINFCEFPHVEICFDVNF